MNPEQFDKIRSGVGFIAALDQSGGSTPKALEQYGIDTSACSAEEMFDLIHAMRSRIITSKAFAGDRILGAILFEQTMDRPIAGRGTAEHLWDVERVVPFLKVDKGLADEVDGTQLMKPIENLDELCRRGVAKGIFGTKMRSVINAADERGVAANVAQQFDLARRILGHGLVPIIEPEVSIHSASKAEAETQLQACILAELDTIDDAQHVMLKLTLPEQDDFYRPLVEHPKVLRVVALSGGHTRQEACARLARNRGVVASFSRALTEGLSAQQSDAEFDATLDAAIAAIFDASST